MKRFELQGSDPKRSTMLKWRQALQHGEGEGEGVRFKTAKEKG